MKLEEMVTSGYQEGKSLRQLSKDTGISYSKCRKILISTGAYTSPMADTIRNLADEGYSKFDIPLDHEGMTVRRNPNNVAATRKSRTLGHVSSQKKRYSPKHLQLHGIAVRPSLLLLALLAAFLLGIAIGLVTRPTTTALAASDDVSHVETVQQTSATPDEIPAQEAAPIAAEPAPEPIRHRDDITSEGRLLSFDLQEVMQDCCEKYNVPYALALAIAEIESHFDPDAKSSPNDFGLMQINAINLDWLRDMGLDPMTTAGNVEAGVYIIAQHLQAYGDPELALMAYNNSTTGARKLRYFQQNCERLQSRPLRI